MTIAKMAAIAMGCIFSPLVFRLDDSAEPEGPPMDSKTRPYCHHDVSVTVGGEDFRVRRIHELQRDKHQELAGDQDDGRNPAFGTKA